jgi:hypothetical protein
VRGASKVHRLTLMRPPVVKRQTNPVSGIFSTFFTGDAGVRTCELTSFRRAGADDTCLHHTRMEVLSPRGGDCTGPVVVLCDLETSRGPRTVLVKEGAERVPLAR